MDPLKMLSRKQLQVVLWKHGHPSATVGQMAEWLGISRRAVKFRLQRATRKLSRQGISLPRSNYTSTPAIPAAA